MAPRDRGLEPWDSTGTAAAQTATVPRSSLPALLAVLALALFAPAPASAQPAGDCVAGADWPMAQPGPADSVVALVNRHRATLRLAPLAASPALTAAAEWKARHMAAGRYFAHADPGPVQRSPDERMQACGYPAQATVGENIAAGAATPDAVLADWLNSPGHRANLERPDFASIGVGVALAVDGTWYWVQDFGSSADGPLSLATLRTGEAGHQSPGAPAGNAGPPGEDTHATAPAVRVRACRRSRRGLTCRLAPGAPDTARARLLRDRRTVARGTVRHRASGAARVRLEGRRALRPGLHVLRLRAGATVVQQSLRLR